MKRYVAVIASDTAETPTDASAPSGFAKRVYRTTNAIANILSQEGGAVLTTMGGAGVVIFEADPAGLGRIESLPEVFRVVGEHQLAAALGAL